MFITRKLGKVLRGSATLPQIVAASALGGMLGFVPGFFLPNDLGGGFMQAPGLIIAILVLVLLLDANLAVFGLVTLGAKLLSIPLLPVSFAVGRVLLDGPLQGLFRWLVNAPVTAFFGLERYATTGGAALGLVVGVGVGIGLWRALHSLRLRMAAVEEGSERYRELSSRRWVRLLAWLFLGKGRGKRTWREVAESDRKGRGVRLVGIGAALVLVAGVWLGQSWLGSGWIAEQARVGLARWNGATVDLADVQLDLAGGRVALAGLAMADAEALDQDVFRARSLELDVATSALLAGRFVVERVGSTAAQSGVVRDQPGRRIDPVEPPPPPPPGPGKTVDDYLKDAEVWKRRLTQAAQWLEKFTGGGKPAQEEAPDQRDRDVARQREALPLVDVVASHVLAGAPGVVVRELSLEAMTFAALGDDRVDVTGSNLSSNPAVADGPATLRAVAKSGSFDVELRFDPAAGDRTQVKLRVKGLQVDALTASLQQSPLAGGTLDLALDGAVGLGADGPWIDVPLRATLHGTTMAVGGKSASLDGVELPLGLSGPLCNPRVLVDGGKIADALVAAGRKELASEVRARASELLGGRLPGVGDALGGLVDGTKTADEIAAEARQRAEEEAARLAAEAKRKAEEEAARRAQDEISKRLPGGLGDLLKKKK